MVARGDNASAGVLLTADSIESLSWARESIGSLAESTSDLPNAVMVLDKSFLTVDRKFPNQLKQGIRFGAKRATDLIVSIVLLILLAPLFGLIALLIKLTDRGSVLFWQTRVGHSGKEFRFPKFRSMVPNAEQLLAGILHENHHKSGVTFKAKRDPRVTWIGRILRRASLDELPQLFCVLTGHMSLVGPRPAVPREVALYTAEERRRLAVTPGLTCIWQVSGRGDVPFCRQVEMDLEYIQNQSLLLDLRLLLLTVPAVITGRGAY